MPQSATNILVAIGILFCSGIAHGQIQEESSTDVLQSRIDLLVASGESVDGSDLLKEAHLSASRIEALRHLIEMAESEERSWRDLHGHANGSSGRLFDPDVTRWDSAQNKRLSEVIEERGDKIDELKEGVTTGRVIFKEDWREYLSSGRGEKSWSALMGSLVHVADLISTRAVYLAHIKEDEVAAFDEIAWLLDLSLLLDDRLSISVLLRNTFLSSVIDQTQQFLMRNDCRHSEVLLARLAAQLADAENELNVASALRGERSVHLGIIRAELLGKEPGSPHERSLLHPDGHDIAQADCLKFLDFVEQYIAIADEDFVIRGEREEELLRTVKQLPANMVLCKSEIPNMMDYSVGYDQVRLRVRMLRVFVAALRCRGRLVNWPSALGDFEAMLGGRFPIDPFTGEKIDWTSDEKGFTVRSPGHRGQSVTMSSKLP